MTATELPGRVDLTEHGIDASGAVYRNPTTSLLYTHALQRGDGKLAEGGPLVVDTGSFTGRSPQDKFLVDEESSTGRIWWGDVNQRLSEEHYDGLREKVVSQPRVGRGAVRRRRVGRCRPGASARSARDHRASVPRSLRADDVHRSPSRRAR